MSLLDKTSLIITPNAVKEGKLYSVVPSDGSGDLTVVRATTATRVNSAGLIEDTPYNLSKNSQQVGVATWTGQNFTLSTEPSGFFPFDLSATCIKGITSAVGYNQIYNISVSTIIGTTYTLTGFLKSDNTPYYFFDLQFVGLNVRVVYDNINKQIITLPIGVTVNINDIGSGWIEFRITSTATLVNNSGSLKVYCSTSSFNIFSGVPVGTTIYATKIQLISGTEPKEYLPTTDRLNVPRLDYTNSTCPSILVEPQRTNLVLRSEEFDNASWTKLATTIIPNTETSPSNVINSDTLIADGSLNTHFFAGTFAVTSGVTYTISIFVKKNTNNFFQIFGSGTIWGTDFFANFDLENGVLGTVGSSAIASIENIQNQWYRCSIRGTALVSGAGFSTAFSLITSANSPRAQQNTLSTSVFIWGAQLEAGSNATSYIPTLASAVTRNADVISKTGISNLINSVQGSLFLEYKALLPINSLGTGISLSNGTNSQLIYVSNTTTTNRIIVSVVNSNGANFNFNVDGINYNNKIKIICKWIQGSFKIFYNGNLIINNTTFNTFNANALNEFSFRRGDGQRTFEGNFEKGIIFPLAISDQECIALTTL